MISSRGSGGAGPSKRPLDAAGVSPKLDEELLLLLREWDLEDDVTQVLAQHGYKNVKRLRKMPIEEVADLGLPRAVERELKEMLEFLKSENAERVEEPMASALDAAAAVKKREKEGRTPEEEIRQTDDEDALVKLLHKNMKRLRNMTNEDVEALGLPFLTAKELKERLGDLTRDLRSKDAKIAEDKLAEKIKVRVPAASAPIAGGGSE